jgi:hypothetical protein
MRIYIFIFFYCLTFISCHTTNRINGTNSKNDFEFYKLYNSLDELKLPLESCKKLSIIRKKPEIIIDSTVIQLDNNNQYMTMGVFDPFIRENVNVIEPERFNVYRILKISRI